MANKNALQEKFLNDKFKKQAIVTIFTINGVQMKGKITGFDQYVVLLLDSNDKEYMIYKHAISTIV